MLWHLIRNHSFTHAVARYSIENGLLMFFTQRFSQKSAINDAIFPTFHMARLHLMEGRGLGRGNIQKQNRQAGIWQGKWCKKNNVQGGVWGKAGKMCKSKTHKQIIEVEGIKIYMSETDKMCFTAAPNATLAILLPQIF